MKTNRTARSINVKTKLTVSFVSLVLFLFTAEIALRLFASKAAEEERNLPFWVLSNIQSQFLVPDPARFWKLPAGSAKYHTNSLGLLGDQVKPDKDADVFRVMCLGDSITFGFGVYYTEAYPYRLERMLNNTRSPLVFEVWNAGVPGYSSLQGYRYFEGELSVFDPDVVTICFGRNDRRYLNQEGGYMPDRMVKVDPQWIASLRTWLSKSRLYQFTKFLVLKKHAGSAVEEQDQRELQRCRVEPDEFSDYISGIVGACRREGATPIIITTPVRLPQIGNYNDLSRSVAAQTEVILLDMAEEFSSRNVEEFLLDDCHPNPLGHEFFADRLFRILIPLIEARTKLDPADRTPPVRNEFKEPAGRS